MPTEGEVTDLVKIAQLGILSTAWGMQFWVTFVAGFVLVTSVSWHTFGLVQSKLLPYYLYLVLGCAFLNLTIYAVYHPRELLSTQEAIQIGLYFTCVVLTTMNAQWFCQSMVEYLARMQRVEREHSLGDEVGLLTRQESYMQLAAKDPKYKKLRQHFLRYHAIFFLCNLVCAACNAVNLYFSAINLKTL
ncbi:transmembrane protein 205 [Latimeria chalumnae]|uniref:transmembrane protein 205 n=1 Tax=Latimeria chalumnae TaxID=7897 RepID=UPI00313CBC92